MAAKQNTPNSDIKETTTEQTEEKQPRKQSTKQSIRQTRKKVTKEPIIQSKSITESTTEPKEQIKSKSIVKNKKMTYYEKLTLFISGIAIIVSILSPFISYYFFDAFRNRARLQIEDDYHVSSSPILPPPNSGGIPTTVTSTTWILTITNTGVLPAKDVRIVFKYESLGNNVEFNPTFAFEPPIAHEQINKKNEITIALQQPIAPDNELIISATEPNEVWVYNEFGEFSNIRTAKGRDDLLKKAQENPIIVEPVK